jgi:molecular chaperone DnaK
VPRGEYRLELAASFKPIGTDSAPMVGGKVVGASAQDFSGFTLELVNAKTQWRSGKVALSPDGVFMTTLHAAHGERNTFVVELFDGGGRKQQIAPDTLTYTIGAVVEEQPLVNSMGIALADNKYAKYFEKGHGLPLRATHDFKTILPLRQGQSGAVLRVPVVEGENEKADRNRMIGELVISPEKIRRDLPVRSDVEITLKIDEARIVTVTAFFPLLDEEFVGTIELIKCTPDPEFLRRDFEAEIKRFREVKSDAANAGGETAGDLIHRVEESPLIQEVRDALAAAKGDPDAAAKCEKRLLELKLKLDEAADALQWPALVAEVREWLDYLQRVVKQNATPQQNERAAALAGEAKELIAAQNAERLRRKLDQIKQLHWEVVFAQPAFWVYQLQQLEEKKEQMVDPQRAARLFDQGGDCIAKNNPTGLQNVVRQLWDLLPNDVVEATRRGYQSSLVK